MGFYKKLRKESYSKEKIQEINENIMKDLHPMAVGIMVSETNKIGDPKTDFERYIVDSTKAILEKRINSKKWIDSINRFVLKRIEEMSAENPEHTEGDKVILKNLVVSNCGSKPSSYGMYFYCIAKNESGWKYYMTSSKFSEIKKGDCLGVNGVVKGNGEEITFLKKIKITYIDKMSEK